MKLEVGLGRDEEGASSVALRLNGGTDDEVTVVLSAREAETIAEQLVFAAKALREREARESKGRQ